ncbi:hypothetical protein STPH2_7251 [Streptomyces sp. KO7888]|nr:hypothetical protein [Streptomyces sp. KO7888]
MSQVWEIFSPYEVIAVVIGHHGDRARFQVGRNHEDLLFGEAHVFREAEAVLFCHGSSEEFVSGQGPDGMGGENISTLDALPERGFRCLPSDSLYFAQNYVRVVAFRRGDHALQCLDAQEIVWIGEEQIIALCEFDSAISRAPGGAGVLLVHDVEPIPARLGPCVEQFAAAVGGPVVHCDDFEVLEADRLVHY